MTVPHFSDIASASVNSHALHEVNSELNFRVDFHGQTVHLSKRHMNKQLDEKTKQKVIEWINQGFSVAQIQKKLAEELNIRLTYMEVKLLLADLDLVPKDQESADQKKSQAPTQQQNQQAQQSPTNVGTVTVTVDEYPQPGTVLSGRVTFSDGQRADWYMDEMGRLGIAPELTGYRPSEDDLKKFKSALQNELARLGYL